MSFRKSSSRWALWVFAAALLLKAAMPMLASASAQAQGKTLVEVCTAYGVSLVPLDGPAHGMLDVLADAHGDAGFAAQPGQQHQPGSDHSPDHASDHCALNALGSFAAVDAPAPALAAALSRERDAPVARTYLQAPDACAVWVARLKHGPPAIT